VVVWWWFDGALFGARYWWIVSSLELPVSVDVHVHVDGVGETSLLLIDVVNGESVIRRAWIWWWNQDDYLACRWTKWTMKCWDIIAERRGTVWSSYREPRMMWIFDVIWLDVREQYCCDFRRFISYCVCSLHCAYLLSLCCKYCYYLFN